MKLLQKKGTKVGLTLEGERNSLNELENLNAFKKKTFWHRKADEQIVKQEIFIATTILRMKKSGIRSTLRSLIYRVTPKLSLGKANYLGGR